MITKAYNDSIHQRQSAKFIWLRKLHKKDSCYCCGGNIRLYFHHITYKNYGNELPEDMITICASCHALVHSIEDKGIPLENSHILLKEKMIELPILTRDELKVFISNLSNRHLRMEKRAEKRIEWEEIMAENRKNPDFWKNYFYPF